MGSVHWASASRPAEGGDGGGGALSVELAPGQLAHGSPERSSSRAPGSALRPVNRAQQRGGTSVGLVLLYWNYRKGLCSPHK